jgi:carbonic anhydrase
MQKLKHLFDNNRNWSAGAKTADPEFFNTLATQQNPEYLWIGCSDSRVPANQITGIAPCEVFVHRNIANVVVHSDFICLSVIEFAVEVLKVKHIIVCGHYGCGGVQAAMEDHKLGLIDNWLRHIRDVRQKHETVLNAIPNEAQRLEKLCELNVVEQVYNVCHTTIVQSAWEKSGRELSIHGWIYSLKDGLLTDTSTCVSGPEELSSIYRLATGV